MFERAESGTMLRYFMG